LPVSRELISRLRPQNSRFSNTKEALDGVGMMEPAAANVLVCRVIDGAMAYELAAQPLIDDRFISRRI